MFVIELYEFWYCTHVSPGPVRDEDMTVVSRVVVAIQSPRDYSTHSMATELCLRVRLFFDSEFSCLYSITVFHKGSSIVSTLIFLLILSSF